MTDKFRIAIVGCGKIATRHVEACLMSPSVRIAALVDPTIGRAEELAEGYGINTVVSTSLDSVIGEIDGAIIAAPNNHHRSLAIQCASSGIPVLIEKPIAGTSEDSIAICEAHEKSGTVCAVGFVTRFRDNNRQMCDLIHSGFFGEIHEFAYQFGSRGGWAPYSAYNLDRQATGGGVLVVTGSHFLDRMLHWFGTPTECALWSDSLGGPEANALASFRFQNGNSNFFGTARFSKTVGLPGGFVMNTSRGIVSLADSPDARITFRPHEQSLQMEVRREYSIDNIFHAQIEDFVRACHDHGSPAVTGREGLRSVLLTEQLYENSAPLSDTLSLCTLEPGSLVHE